MLRWHYGLIFFAGIAFLLVSCSSKNPAAPSPEIVTGMTMAARGKAIFQASCATCHGARGEGAPNWREQNPDKSYPPPPHDSTGHTWHHADGLLFRIVRDGGKRYEDSGFKSNMPAFGDRLSPIEIRAVIAYLKTLWGPKELEFQAQASLEDPFSP